MKFRLSATLVVFAAALWTLQSVHVRTQPTTSASDREDFQGRPAVAHEVLVRVRSGMPLSALHAAADAVDDQPIGSQGWHRIRSSSRLVQELLTALRGRSEVLDIEPNYIVHVDAVPNDPSFSAMWNLLNTGTPGADIHATGAWDVTIGSTANVVGVVDTGVDYTHPDLAANMWSAPAQFTIKVGSKNITCPAGSHGFNAIAFTCDPMEDLAKGLETWHGTHVSGTIGAVGNNSIGVVGVNWTTRIMGLKFMDSVGGSTSDAVNAIDFALQVKAAFANTTTPVNVRVLSNSWGGGGFSSALSNEITAANNADVLFVAAAGNSTANIDSPNPPVYPASYSQANVVAVAATTETDGIASFSNYGPKTVALGAPGNNIGSTVPGGYGGASGTSMAAPHVSGAAMLILSACALNTQDLKAAILNNVDPLASLNGMVLTGGRLNVDRAVRSCATVPTVSLTSPIDNGAPFTAPASIPLAATASDPDGIDRVEFYQGTALIGTSKNLPYGGSWNNVPAGNYTITAKAFDKFGAYKLSAPAHVNVTGSGGGSTAAFLDVDATTQGSWIGSKGVDGAIVANDSSRQPAYGTLLNQAPTFTWVASTTDVRALQKAIGTDRIASTWYGGTVSMDVNVTDGMQHRFSIYLVDWDNLGRVERVEVRDATNNALLDTRTVSGFASGQYVEWAITGHVVINVMCVSGVNAVVSGAFFGPAGGNAPPIVNMTAPTEGQIYTAPAAISLAATARDTWGPLPGISRVEFYQGSTLIATSNNGNPDGSVPYTAPWNGVAAGSYTLTAKAYDSSTPPVTAMSAPVHVTVNGAAGGSSATFVGADSTTQGSWRGVYGGDGAIVANDSTRQPTYGAATTTAPTWTWAASTTDVRALQKAAASDRIAATWYGGVSIDVNLTDGSPHHVSLYLIDWDNLGRAERVEVRDATSNTLLDSRSISNFTNGQYLTWTVQGHVVMNVVLVSGVNSVASGIFFDAASGNAPPAVTLTGPAEGANYIPGASIPLSARATDSNGINRVEFYQGSTLVATSMNGLPDGTRDYSAPWNSVPAGNYTLTAKAYDTLGASSVSLPVHVTVSAGGSTSATFVATDTTTQGTWRGMYGGDGAIVANDSTRQPTYGTVTTAAPSWTWAASTADVRALQKAAASDRIAATWYGAITFDVNLTDGAAHHVSLYVIDWDSLGRAERVEVRDATTNTLLDSRSVSSFTNGQYLKWTVQGHVVINVIVTAGVNAVTSGVFFDP
jgi:subtilisin family serine protease